MKKYIVLLLFTLFQGIAYAQSPATGRYKAIVPEELSIATGKTTNLIYPYPVKSVDRGSGSLLVQKAKGIETVLQIKAAREQFAETNLTVITSDGHLYSYIVHYDECTTQLNLDYTGIHGKGATISMQGENEAQAAQLSALASGAKRNTCNRDTSNGIRLLVDGVYIHEGLLFFRIKLDNTTNINYDISQFRFFIRDQKKAKRTASQETEVEQRYVYNPVSIIKGKSRECVVVAVPKFTIPDKKEMVLQVMEKDGGRHLEVRLRDRAVMKALPISN